MTTFKYILKRIIIGTGVVLLLSFIRGNLLIGVSAKQISSVGFGGVSHDYDASENNYLWDVPNGSWANWGSGLLYGSVSVQKTAGSSTSHFSPIRAIISRSNNGLEYQCYFGSMSSNNSTFERQIISYYCPMTMGPQGLESLSFVLLNDGSADFSARMNINGTLTFVQDDTFDTSGISGSINNQISNDNTNTQNIINNQNQNNQNIINNQNSNTDKEIESQMSCTIYDKNNIKNHGYLDKSGNFVALSNNLNDLTSDFIQLNYSSKIELLTKDFSGNRRICFYNSSKSFISCLNSTDMQLGNVTIPDDTSFVRFHIIANINKPTYKICSNGNQAIVDSQNNINNTLNDDNVDAATSHGSSFFNNFNSNSHGLSGVITAPLRLINSFTGSSCSPLEFDLPFVGNHVVLPCMKGIYERHFGIFFSLWQLITTGLISYNIMINLYSKIHNLQNPNNDRIEVLNL